MIRSVLQRASSRRICVCVWEVHTQRPDGKQVDTDSAFPGDVSCTAPATPLLVSTMMPRPPSPSPAYSASSYSTHNPSISAQYERKQKQRALMGITAGAEDEKYKGKYRDLKKKVKEIESVSHDQSTSSMPSALILSACHLSRFRRTMTSCISSCCWQRRTFAG